MLSRWLTRSRSRGGDDADFVSIESSEEKTVEITDLTPETSYKLTAIAYNADQRPSNPATATFTTSKISDDQLFYCNQRGLSTEDAVGLIVNGYAREVLAKLPMEFAVEAQKLLSISLEGSVG